MSISLTCRNLGSTCDHIVEGYSLESIVASMQKHAVEVHDFDVMYVMSDEMATRMRAAVVQSSRPTEVRSARLGF